MPSRPPRKSMKKRMLKLDRKFLQEKLGIYPPARDERLGLTVNTKKYTRLTEPAISAFRGQETSRYNSIQNMNNHLSVAADSIPPSWDSPSAKVVAQPPSATIKQMNKIKKAKIKKANIKKKSGWMWGDRSCAVMGGRKTRRKKTRRKTRRKKTRRKKTRRKKIRHKRKTRKR